MPRINKMTVIGSQGVVHGMYQLPDAWKWAFVEYTATTQTPPPRASTLRVSRHTNARFLLNCAINAVRPEGDELVIETTQGPLRYDYLIAATGFSNDFSGRSEIAAQQIVAVVAKRPATSCLWSLSACHGAGPPEHAGSARPRTRI